MSYTDPNVIQGQAIGTAVAVYDSTALAALPTIGMKPGTAVYNSTVGSSFILTVSSASLVTDSVVAVSGITGWRWIIAAAGITPTQSAKLAAVDLFQAGTALTDADTTIAPGTDKASEYTLPAATLSANRVLTLGVTGSPATSLLVQVTRRDLAAHTYTVKDDAGTTLLTFASAPTAPQGASFTFNGTHFVLAQFFYVAV